MNIRKKNKRGNELKTKWFHTRLAHWFELNNRKFPWRKRDCSKYQLIIAEVLLQRTQAETVSKFYLSFIKKFPSWRTLAKAKKKDLQAFLKPIGLWRQRANAIKNLSAEMAKRHGRFPKTREEIEKIPAVGQYIANAVLMFCHNQPQPLLDVNMARVLERFFGPRKLADIRYDPYLQQLARDILPKTRFQEFNWAILDFASMVCKPQKPLCENCCLANKCLFYEKQKKLKRRK
jgi:A/G-specific adenine glycosylase